MLQDLPSQVHRVHAVSSYLADRVSQIVSGAGSWREELAAVQRQLVRARAAVECSRREEAEGSSCLQTHFATACATDRALEAVVGMQIRVAPFVAHAKGKEQAMRARHAVDLIGSIYE